jgi:DNA-binding transcriptional regulator PaaX
MKSVKRIANTGRSVICTIHQPSSQLFFMFDRLLLLRSGGDAVYFDDIGVEGQQLVHYFEHATQEAPKLPAGINPANWMCNTLYTISLSLSLTHTHTHTLWYSLTFYAHILYEHF